MQSQTVIFSKLVRDFMRPNPLAVGAHLTMAEVIGRMAAAGGSSATVVDDDGRPMGIITEKDITHRVTFLSGAETPVGQVMTQPVVTIPADEYLYHAIARMRRLGLRHMPAVETDGTLSGMLNLHDALAAAADRLVDRIDRLTHEGTLEGLKDVKTAQVELADELFAEGLPASEIQALITHVNNDIYRRVVDAALAGMAEEEWGAPPVPFSAIVFGSGGRGENYLFPDQDNGFILGEYPDEDHTRIDGYFIELAERMTRALDAVGFPYCDGYCMATNPLWRKKLSQWIEQIGIWGRKHHFVAIRLADIFFDFRGVWGEPALAEKLRRRVTPMVQGNHFFLQAMYHEEAEHDVGLTFFGGFVTEKDKAEYKGFLSLKHTALLPLVGAVRLLALREGIEETATLKRLQALHAMGFIDADEHEYLSSAFGLLTEILLKSQIKDFQAGRKVGYYVDPKTLSKRQTDLLADSLKAIDDLRDRIKADFTANIF